MSEYENPELTKRQPTVEDVRELIGPSTPHFALQVRARIENLIEGLPPGHPARTYGEREILKLAELAFEGEHRGAQGEGEPEMPSLRIHRTR